MKLFINPSVYIDLLSFFAIVLIFRNMRGAAEIDETGRLFRALLAVAAATLVADAVCWQLDCVVFPFSRELIILFSSLLYITQALYCAIWLRYEILWVYGGIRMNLRLWTLLSLLPLLLECALIAANLWTQRIFVVSEKGLYRHADDYWMALGVIFIYVLWAFIIIFVGIARAQTREQRHNCMSMLQFMLIQLFGTASEIFSLNISMTPALITFGLLMLYLDVQQRRTTQQQLVIAQQKQALTEKQVAIMLSQIQPHFLYNALNTIQNLCRKNPQMAVTAVGDFADYLRGNLDSLSQKGLIRFEKELEHIRTYCELELLRFDHVRVEYDLAVTSFAVPPLTVQPLVENAIRYGVSKKLTPGTVTVSTRETPDAYRIIVADDGVGFDPAAIKQDGRTHIGIENARSRLASQCGGVLDIESTPGAGTTAAITIPKGGRSI